MKALAYITVMMVSLTLVLTAEARQLFWDDFEGDTLGAEPSKWENLGVGSGEGGEIIPDPENGNNKVFSMPDRFVAGARDHGAFYVIGDESWVDYIAEWDWMPNDGYHGMNFRFQNDDEYYLIDKRGGEGIVQFYRRQAAWTQFAQGPWLWAANEWYRVRLEVSGDSFVFRWKELGDDTPFNQIDVGEAGVEGQDANYADGGMSNGGLGLIDNIVVGETEDDLALGVEPTGKIPTVWAGLKEL